jgi:predicted DNA-binding transcriptional regulator AlpA
MNYLSVKQIAKKLCIAESTVWKYTQQSDFPKKVQLSPKCSRWIEHEIDEWVQSFR